MKHVAAEYRKHGAYEPPPVHHFSLRFDKRDVKVATTFPITRANSKAYKDELTAHIKRVEREQAVSMAKPKPFRFYTR